MQIKNAVLFNFKKCFLFSNSSRNQFHFACTQTIFPCTMVVSRNIPAADNLAVVDMLAVDILAVVDTLAAVDSHRRNLDLHFQSGCNPQYSHYKLLYEYYSFNDLSLFQ